jgi:hypothetical protein
MSNDPNSFLALVQAELKKPKTNPQSQPVTFVNPFNYPLLSGQPVTPSSPYTGNPWVTGQVMVPAMSGQAMVPGMPGQAFVPGMSGAGGPGLFPYAGQINPSTQVVSTKEFDEEKRRTGENLKYIASALESQGKALKELSKATGHDVRYHPFSRTAVGNNLSSSGKAIAAPQYSIRTTKGQDAFEKTYNQLMKTGDITHQLAEDTAFEDAREADDAELASGAGAAAGGAGGSRGGSSKATKSAKKWAELQNKRCEITKDVLAYARDTVGLDVRGKKAGNLLKQYSENRDLLGFGYVETAPNPFAAPTQDDIDDFEAFKKKYGFPAGVWDGMFQP